MCRNIKTLFNFNPVATDEEIQASSEQYVRKISGYQKPSTANQEAFDRAVSQVNAITRELVDSLVTEAQPKIREVEAAKARERAIKRFG